MAITESEPAEEHTPNSSTWVRLFIYVFLLSLTVRVLWVANAYVSPIGDHHGYNRSALEWLETGKYRVRGCQYAYKPPGYPALLAAIYGLWGQDWKMVEVEQAVRWHQYGLLLSHDWKVVGFVQAVIGATVSGLLALLAGTIVSFRVGLLAGLMHVFWPTAIAFVPVLANDNLTVFLLVAGLLCLTRIRTGRGAFQTTLACCAGMCQGLMLLVRPSSIFFMPAWLILAGLDPVHRRWHPRTLLLCALSIGVVVGPWLYYTYSVGLGVGVFSTQGGYALWWGNNWRSVDGGNPSPPRFPGDRELSEREQHEFFMRKAFDWIKDNPGRYLALSRTRLVRMFGKQQDVWAAKYFFPTAENDRLLRAVYWPGFATPEDVERGKQLELRNRRLHLYFRIILAPLMLLGILYAFLHPRKYAIVLLPLLCYAAGHALTAFAGRYRVTSDPLILLCLAGFLSGIMFSPKGTGFWRGRWPKLILAILVVTGSIGVHVSGVDRGWYRLPAPPTPQPEFHSSLGSLLEFDLSNLERIKEISTKTCDVELQSTPAGLRCELRGSPAESGFQYGGITLSVDGMTAVRMDVTWLKPENIDALFVSDRDETGRICQRWEWRPRRSDANPVPDGRGTYVLVAGQPSGHFRSAVSEPGSRVSQLSIIVRIKPNTSSGFVLHDLDAALVSRSGFDTSLGNLVEIDLSNLDQIRQFSSKTCHVQVSTSSAGLRCEMQGTPVQLGHQYGMIDLPVDGMTVVRLDVTWLHPKCIEAIFVEGRDGQGHTRQRWEWRLRNAIPRAMVRPMTHVLVAGKSSDYFEPAVNDADSHVVWLRIIVRIKHNSSSGFVLHNVTVASGSSEPAPDDGD